MQEDQEQKNLIKKEIKKIQNSYKSHQKSYTLNSFNNQFDICLKRLVVVYKFNFQKISLHLYYQFPQYEQKITTRSISFRWWQIQKEKSLNQELIKQQSKQQNKQKQDGQFGFQTYQQYTKSMISSYGNQVGRESLQAKMENNLKYQQALSMSEILTEQQSEKFILYKPKFIVDTEFKLETYQIDISMQDDLNISFVQTLKKVMSNEICHQFGQFSGVTSLDENHFKKEIIQVPLKRNLTYYQDMKLQRQKNPTKPSNPNHQQPKQQSFQSGSQSQIQQSQDQYNQLIENQDGEVKEEILKGQVRQEFYLDQDWQAYQSD